jgi:cell pole-organizing protein PopZ
MTQAAKSQEPSMEEILASIRRIIADDDATKAPPKPAEPPARVTPPQPEPIPESHSEREQLAPPSLEEQASDILDLTESMAAPSFSQPAPEPAPQFRKIEGISDVGFDDAEQKPAMPKMPDAAAMGERDRLLSGVTSAAVDSAFNTLAQTVLVQNARTLEDLVREMLRPMLKSWLDDNLPGLVERLVRAEIERVARGR